MNIDTHDLDAALLKFGEVFDLPIDQDALKGAVAALANRHYAKPPIAEVHGDIETMKFRRDDTRHFPSAALLASPLIGEMVKRHYAIDIDTTATRDSAGELFAEKV